MTLMLRDHRMFFEALISYYGNGLVVEADERGGNRPLPRLEPSGRPVNT